MPMDPELKAAWVEALRSGKYKQAKKTLHNKTQGSYCCLGVLCEVAKPEGWNGFAIDLTDEHGYRVYDDAGLPYQTLQELKLFPTDHNILMVMNDKGARFKSIAKYIEKHL